MKKVDLGENYLYETDRKWKPPLDLKCRELKRLKYLQRLGYKDEIEFDLNVEEERVDFQNFERCEEERAPTDPEPRDSLTSKNDLGWFHLIKSSNPWEEKEPLLKLIEPDPDDLDLIAASAVCNLDRIPLSDKFALTKIELQNQGLYRIDVLEKYLFLQYIDISHNHITDIEPIKSLYLVYLNASHNELETFSLSPPPWYLTFLGLSHNFFTQVPDLAPYWSLKCLDLSHNKIEKITGISNLKYLRYVNLSHNEIKQIENINNVPVLKLDLSYNQITGTADTGLETLMTLEEFDISNNFLERLNFFSTSRLKKLNVSNNKLSSIIAVNDLNGMHQLRDLKIYDNEINKLSDVNRLIVHLLPSLNTLNCDPVNPLEKLSAYCLYGQTLFTDAISKYSYNILKEPLEPPALGIELPDTDTNPSIVLLIGPPGSNRHVIADQVASKYPKYVRSAKYHVVRIADSDLQKKDECYVTTKEFETMQEAGKFIFVSCELGRSFGLCCDELKNDGKVVLIPIVLDDSLVLKWKGFETTRILIMIKSVNNHIENLKLCYFDSQEPTDSESQFSMNLKPYPSLTLSETISTFSSTTSSDYSMTPSRAVQSEASLPFAISDETIEKSPELSKTESKNKSNSIWWCDDEEVIEEETIKSEGTFSFKCLKDYVQQVMGQRKDYERAYEDGYFNYAVGSDDIDSAVIKIGEIANTVHNTRDIREEIYDNNVKKDIQYEKLVNPYIDEMENILEEKDIVVNLEMKPPFLETQNSMSSLRLSIKKPIKSESKVDTKSSTETLLSISDNESEMGPSTPTIVYTNMLQNKN